MASKMTDLAVIDTNKIQLVPSADELASLREELADIDHVPFGRIDIAAAGAGVFKVTEPGEDEAVVATEITGVIIMSHKTNALWLSKFGTTDNVTPDCASMNGDTGIDTATGECRDCATCAYNQYGTAINSDGTTGRGKQCKNGRRLYIMREGDVFPMLLRLPPTALTVFDKYRTRILLGRKKIYGVLTKITLKTAKNSDGVAYSTPVFEPVAALPLGEAERVRQYAESFTAAAERVGVTSDDGGAGQTAATATAATTPKQGGFVEIPPDEPLPFE